MNKWVKVKSAQDINYRAESEIQDAMSSFSEDELLFNNAVPGEGSDQALSGPGSKEYLNREVEIKDKSPLLKQPDEFQIESPMNPIQKDVG